MACQVENCIDWRGIQSEDILDLYAKFLFSFIPFLFYTLEWIEPLLTRYLLQCVDIRRPKCNFAFPFAIFNSSMSEEIQLPIKRRSHNIYVLELCRFCNFEKDSDSKSCHAVYSQSEVRHWTKVMQIFRSAIFEAAHAPKTCIGVKASDSVLDIALICFPYFNMKGTFCDGGGTAVSVLIDSSPFCTWKKKGGVVICSWIFQDPLSARWQAGGRARAAHSTVADIQSSSGAQWMDFYPSSSFRLIS